MNIVPDEAKRVRMFVIRLTFSIRSYVFKPPKEGASLRSIVSTTKEVELMVMEGLRDHKRV